MDERNWTDRPLPQGETIRVGTAEITRLPPPCAAYLISGDLSAALDAAAPRSPVLGLLEDTNGALPQAIRIARSAALLVCDAPIEAAPGWHAAGFGISDATDSYAPFQIKGEGTDWVLAQGGIADPQAHSPSAATLFAGLTCLLVRNGTAANLWFPRAQTTYVSEFLRGMSPVNLA